jgi:hypothetical protein
MTGPEPGGPGTAERRNAAGPAQHDVELVGPDLRVSGRLSLGRFTNLADLVNHNRRFLVLHEARLLQGAGGPTDLVLPELVVSQDEITFVGDRQQPDDEPPGADRGPATTRTRADSGTERSGPDGHPRQFVIFTPGHAITGGLHLFREMTLANFVEATDPRFIPVSDATCRSLSDPDAVSRFEVLLVNRTQIGAIAESDDATDRIAAAVRAVSSRQAASQESSAPYAAAQGGEEAGR